MLQTIIPTPKYLDQKEGTTSLPLMITTDHAPWREYVNTLRLSLEKIFEVALGEGEGGILLHYDESCPKEHYVMDSTQGITLSASDDEGILYAIATAIQSVSVNAEGIHCPKAILRDHPDKSYRALMVDLAREWHPAYTVSRYIDVCFILKIKYLHLHFIDDQRYTLPSRIMPALNEGCRHYSFEEIQAMRDYARARGIILIPEFEAPGHAAFLVRAYPEYFANHMMGDDDSSFVTEDGALVSAANLLCAGNPATKDAIRRLLGEICEMFPDSPYIHIGGDEANIKAWNGCCECVRYMKENQIEDIYELYSDFIGKVAQMVIDYGRTPIVWEGFPKKGAHRVPKETVVIAWESHYQLVGDLLEAGYKVINGSWLPLYIVPGYKHGRWGVEEILSWNVYNWQHWWSKSEAKLNPIHIAPTDQLIGAQLSSWECTYEQEIGKIMENLSALSERTWNLRRHWTDHEFQLRLFTTLTTITRLVQDV